MFRKGFLLREEVPEGEEKTRLTLIQEAGLLVWLGRGSTRNWQKGAFLH